MLKPIAYDLCCGLGGWTEGLLAEGYDPIGFDIVAHEYGEHRYPGRLIIQDILTLHGSRLKDAALIVASPPCQEYSYMAMPWKLAKAKAAAIRADTTGVSLEKLNRLFNACFRIQKEASLAASRHIPMVVENVRGAIPWVGRSRWNFGSFHLWGDVPALMPQTTGSPKFIMDDIKNGQRRQIDGIYENGAVIAVKVPGLNWSDHGKPGYKPKGFNVTAAQRYREDTGKKTRGGWFGAGNNCSPMRQHSSKSDSRKAASAMIAKIPLPLSRHIARTYHPGKPLIFDRSDFSRAISAGTTN